MDQTKVHTGSQQMRFGSVSAVIYYILGITQLLTPSLVTGCSSGIGQSLAQLITKYPNRIVATARNPATLSAIPDGANILKLALDVTSISSIEDALSQTLTKFGRIDILVNNAGYTLVGDTEAAEDRESHALFETNFWGMVNITKRALGIMRDQNPKGGGQQGGVVFNISSMGGFIGFPGSAFYHASKFAMEGWTEAIAKELPTEWNSMLSPLSSVCFHLASLLIQQM